MPQMQSGSLRKLASGKWQLRYYDTDGAQRSGGTFSTRGAAREHFRDVIEPQLCAPQAMPEITLDELVEKYLNRHKASARTISTLRERLAHATRPFGTERLRDLEGMSGDLADWQNKLPERSRHGIVQALRQTLGAAVRWDYMTRNPALLAGPNPQPPPRTVRPFTLAEVDAIAAELSAMYEPLPAFAAATGLRPEEWAALERRDVDRRAGVVTVRSTVSDGVVRERGKTRGSRRQVPLSRRALAALSRLPSQLATPLLFPAPGGGLLNLDNFRSREWAPAIEAAGIVKPARIYDLRATFASNALAANVTVFELARIMGTSVRMIEHHYGALLDGAHAGISGRLDAVELTLEKAATA